MKKMYALLAIMMVSMCAMGQSIKVQAKFAKGEYAIYESTATMEIAMPTGESEKASSSGEVKYEVTDARSDGYTIAITTLKWDGGGNEAGSLGDFSAMQEEMLVGKTIILDTDKDGKVVRIANYDELKKQMETMANGIVDKIFAEVDANSAPMKKENVKDALMSELTEENILKSALHSSNQFSLYGKTIATGTTEDETVNHMKMKTSYFVLPQKSADNYTIKSSSVINMDKEDMKKLIIDMVTKMAPDQADMVKQNIDMLLDSGMMKIEGSRTCTYNMLANGWLQEGEMTQKTNTMGSESTTTNTWKIKECSWKK